MGMALVQVLPFVPSSFSHRATTGSGEKGDLSLQGMR